MTTAIELNHLWKKFNRGEFNDCLRDAIPAWFGRLCGRKSSVEVLGQKEFWALQDLDFKIESGETVGFIGHNGAGKSTLLKVLSNILEPTRGNMIVHGKLRSLIEIGSGFHGDLTGRENIYLNGAILGMTHRQIQQNFDSIVDFSGIEEFLDMPVKRYSSGMYARLGFAVAAHLEPDILIVDEVLSVGDASFQKKCLGKMSDVAQSGRTVLFVSHNMGAVQQLCQRAILIKRGEVLADGPTKEVINEYLGNTELQGDGSLDDDSLHFGDQRARIKRVLIGSSLDDLSVVHVAQPGETLVVTVEYETRQPIPYPVVQVIFGGLQELLLDLNTRITPTQTTSLGTRGRIVFRVPRLPLAPGDYPVYVTIKDRKGSGMVTLVDEVTHAASLKVMEENTFQFDLNNGFYGRCIAPYTWCQEE